MPYIDPNDRPALDHPIEALVNALSAGHEAGGTVGLYEVAGKLNYALTRVTLGVWHKIAGPKVKYPALAILSGVLHHVSLELYRRMAVPYEEAKIYDNGDVPEFAAFRDKS